jgi:hypothetical protein
LNLTLSNYNAALPLILDPVVLLYGGYLGGSNSDSGNSIAVDGAGNVYVTGYTYSTEASFPLLAGPDLVFNGGADAFVAKVSSDGASLLYAGYIGGSSDEFGHGIAVDGSGNAYVTGLTSSTEATFPVLGGPDLIYNGGFDAFVAKVSSDGASLLYAGYIGASGADYGYGIAVDGSGHAYVTGLTSSTEATFPVLGGPDLTYNGDFDGFVAKVSSNGSSLLYAGYIGGSGFDSARGIAVDGSDNTYVTGFTNSTEGTFPVLAGPDLTYNGGVDAFVAKVSGSDASLLYAGYIGGSGDDLGLGIAVNGSGNAYVTGYTTSTEASFPVLGGPDLTFNGGADAFVASVSSSGASLLYAGYIGGLNDDHGYAITVDGSGNAFITGYTTSREDAFPVSGGPDLTYNGSTDVFVASVSSSGASLLFAGYIGGTGADYGYGIAVDGLGNAYVTGNTTSTEASFPVVGGPDLTYNGGSDAFVVKVVADDMPPASSASSPAYANTVPISVSWSAGDDNSGVNSTTLWVKYGSGGAWNATDLSQPGHSGIFDYIPAAGDGAYYFATVATDYAGNIEPAPIGSGDDATIYDTAAPSSLASAPAHAAAAPISVDWNAEDATSGVDSVALWVKYGHGGSWVKAGLSQFGQSGVFHYVPTSGGGTYYFATVATDHAGNVEANPIGLGHTATVYEPATALFLPVVLRK